MSALPPSNELIKLVALLAAAVVAVPVFRRLGFSSVLGYLAGGLAIGPFGLKWFHDPQAILHVAELGVVLFLFVVGLEMRPLHLWSLRRQIFGLGTLQITVCTLALTGVGLAFGLHGPAAFIAAAGFVLTSTATVMQLLGERGDITLPHGQKIVSVLLLEDLLIVPLLALVALLSPRPPAEGGLWDWRAIGLGIACLAALIAAGMWLLNPLFRVLAKAKAREVMTSAALLVVLGAALLMQLGGLPMAMGAFVAGVLLSESTFRHQIQADIEPFRGVLLGLFFLAVGMALDLAAVAQNWLLVSALVVTMMITKALCIYLIGRLTHSSHGEALDRAVLMAQGGEFAFMLYAAAAAAGLIDARVGAHMTAVVVLSMALTPLVVVGARRFMPGVAASMDVVQALHDRSGSVLIIGFGRFGQVMSQLLLARDIAVTIIDNDIDMVRSAEEFGFRIFFGDGTRLDVLHASGAATARAIAVCTDERAVTNRIVALVREAFPQAKVLARSFDREHALQLVKAGVDYQIRETFESALRFGQAALVEMGVDADEAARTAEQVRRLDGERFDLELAAGDIRAGIPLLIGNTAPGTPTPLTAPRRESQVLNPSSPVNLEDP